MKNYADDLDAYAGIGDIAAPSKNSPAQSYMPSDDLEAYASAPEPKQNKKKKTIIDEIGRQLGLTVRDITEGNPYVSLPLMVGDIANSGLNYGIKGINKLADTRIPTFGSPSREFSKALTDIGVPEPSNGFERIINNTAKGVVGAAGGVSIGNALSTSSNPILAGVGNTLVNNPVSQLSAGASGAAAASAAQEAGASPMVQLLAGLGGALLSPTVAATGENVFNRLINNPSNVEKNIAIFGGVGTTPTIGQATQSPLAQNIESFLSKMPGSSNIIAEKANQQAAQMGNKLNEVSSMLSPRATSSSAGRAIEKGISGDGGFISRFKNKSSELYDKLDEHIPDDTLIPVANTQRMLSILNADIPGAEEISKLFRNSKIKGIESALNKDLRADQPTELENAYLNAFPYSNVFNPQGKQSIKIPGTQKEGEFIPYEAVKKLRTVVGQQLQSDELATGAPRDKWKALYGALSEDLGDVAIKTSPEAAKVWNRANAYYKTGSDRIDLLKGIVNKDTPEAIYKAAISGVDEGATNINAVMQSLPAKEKRVVTANLLKKIGKATPGNQDDTGSTFSINTFLTNWNKLSPEAKQSLFSRKTYGNDFERTMNDLASTAYNLKTGSKVFANPSGTASSNALIDLGLSALKAPVYVAGKYLGSNKLAKYMVDPRNVESLQNYSGFDIAPYAKAAAINQLIQSRNK